MSTRQEQERLLKAAMAEQGTDLAPVGPQILFPAARIDIIRAQDPVSGAPIVNLVIGAGNGALSVVVPIPAMVSAQQAINGGLLVPATVQIAQKLVEPEYRVVKVDASGLSDAPTAVAGGDLEVEAEIDPPGPEEG